MRRALPLLAAGLLLACSTSDRADRGGLPALVPQPRAPEHAPTPPPPEPTYPQPCHEIYADDVVPDFYLEAPPDTFATMREEAKSGIETWYPATFRYEDDVVPVMIRNRGNKPGLHCGKLQIAIDFNREVREARWRGLRRITLDTGHCRLFDERLSLSFARDAGLHAPCANHARLYLNGEYEGLYTNLEHVDKTFLTRNFGPDGNDGNLWYDGWRLKTNEEAPTSDPTNRRWRNETDLAKIEEMADLERAIREWAAEAVLPATDNFWVDGWNYWLYEHPEHGFLYMPRDWDKATPWSTKWVRFDPLALDSAQHPASIVLADPAYRALFVEELRRMIELYDPDVARDRLEDWWEEVLPAAAEDPYLDIAPDDPPPHRMVDAIRDRRSYLRERLAADE